METEQFFDLSPETNIELSAEPSLLPEETTYNPIDSNDASSNTQTPIVLVDGGEEPVENTAPPDAITQEEVVLPGTEYIETLVLAPSEPVIDQPETSAPVLDQSETSAPEIISDANNSPSIQPSKESERALPTDQADQPGQEVSEPDSSMVGRIYKLLDERLPERSIEQESETEIQSESQSESEISLAYIEQTLDDIRQFESEQLDFIETMESNQVVSSNNSYHMGYYQIAITTAIWGSIVIFLFFRKIG